MHFVRNAILLVWSSLRLTPIKASPKKLSIEKKQMKGWHAKTHTNKGSYKSEGKHTKPHSTFSLYCEKDVAMDKPVYIYLHLCNIPCLCVHFDMPSLHHFLFLHDYANGSSLTSNECCYVQFSADWIIGKVWPSGSKCEK